MLPFTSSMRNKKKINDTFMIFFYKTAVNMDQYMPATQAALPVFFFVQCWLKNNGQNNEQKKIHEKIYSWQRTRVFISFAKSHNCITDAK